MKKSILWIAIGILSIYIFLEHKDKIFAASVSQTQISLSIIHSFSGLATLIPSSGTMSGWIYQTENPSISFLLESNNASQFIITWDIQTVILWGSGINYSWIVSANLTPSTWLKYIFIQFFNSWEYLPPQIFTINFQSITVNPPPDLSNSFIWAIWRWGWGGWQVIDHCPLGDSSPTYQDGLCDSHPRNWETETDKKNETKVKLPVRVIPNIQNPIVEETIRTDYQTDKPPHWFEKLITTIITIWKPKLISTVIERNIQYITQYNDKNQENILVVKIQDTNKKIEKIIHYNTQSEHTLRERALEITKEVSKTIKNILSSAVYQTKIIITALITD